MTLLSSKLADKIMCSYHHLPAEGSHPLSGKKQEINILPLSQPLKEKSYVVFIVFCLGEKEAPVREWWGVGAQGSVKHCFTDALRHDITPCTTVHLYPKGFISVFVIFPQKHTRT